jgi:hypothetical protein
MARSHALLTRLPLPVNRALDLHVLSLPPAFVLSQNQTLRLRSDPDALGIYFKVQRDTVSANKRPKRVSLFYLETHLSESVSYGGLTHRRTPPPAFLFPINNVKEQNHQQLPSSPIWSPRRSELVSSSRRGGCLGPPHF